METTVANLARRSSQRLTGIDDRLPAVVEAKLLSSRKPPERYDAAILISLAGLVLNVAKLAWDIYRDMKKAAPSPSQETIIRRLRLEVEIPSGVTAEQRDTVIAAVTAELPS